MPVSTTSIYTPQAISIAPYGTNPNSIIAMPSGGVSVGSTSDLGSNVSAMFLDAFTAGGTANGSIALVGYSYVDLALLTDGQIAVATIEDDELTIWKSNPGFSGGSSVNRINDGGIRSLDVTALQSGSYAVALEDVDAGNHNIELRMFNAQNQQTVHVTVAGSAFEESDPDILAFDDGSFVIAWTLDTAGNTAIWHKHYAANGSQTGPATLVNGSGSHNENPSLALTDTGYAIAWEDNSSGSIAIHMATYSPTGILQSTANVTPGLAAGANDPQLTTLPNGQLALTYHTTSGGQSVLATRLIDPSNLGAATTAQTIVTTSATIDAPQVTYAQDGHLWFAWSETLSGTTTSHSAVVTPGLRHVVSGGSETILASELNEIFIGAAGLADTVDYSQSTEAITTDLAQSGTSGLARGDTYLRIEGLIGSDHDDNLTGNIADNHLRGGAGNDTLFGGDGQDFLDGQTGADTMQGGLGNDTYFVDDAGDVITGEVGFSIGGGIDTIRAFVDYTQPDNVELLRLGFLTDTTNLNGTGNDGPGTLVGNAGNNILTGRGGDDQINGNDGNDSLIGNTGQDTLVGGAGADTFVLTAVADSRAGATSRDFINGFTHGQDRIDFSAIDANRYVAGHQSWDFIGNAAFDGDGANSAGQIRYFTFGGGNYNIVEADLNGDGTADMQLFVNLTNWMTGSDFIL